MPKIIYIKDGEDSKSQLIIDGEQIDSSNYSIGSNIHAIQWEDSSGEIEYNDGTPNAIITDISSFDFENLEVCYFWDSKSLKYKCLSSKKALDRQFLKIRHSRSPFLMHRIYKYI